MTALASTFHPGSVLRAGGEDTGLGPADGDGVEGEGAA